MNDCFFAPEVNVMQNDERLRLKQLSSALSSLRELHDYDLRSRLAILRARLRFTITIAHFVRTIVRLEKIRYD